jgi:hypothetical protein
VLVFGVGRGSEDSSFSEEKEAKRLLFMVARAPGLGGCGSGLGGGFFALLLQ